VAKRHSGEPDAARLPHDDLRHVPQAKLLRRGRLFLARRGGSRQRSKLSAMDDKPGGRRMSSEPPVLAALAGFDINQRGAHGFILVYIYVLVRRHRSRV
jgi:hypothetical protein